MSCIFRRCQNLWRIFRKCIQARVPGKFYRLIKETAWEHGTARDLRGSTLEEMVNWTNDHYLEKGLALIQKIPTPITPVRMDADHKQITLAYFEKRSTVDYIGAVQGIPVCFDAKECVADTFPLHNIHEHQITFMTQFEHQDGIAFILIYYSERNELYYMRFEEMIRFWNRACDGGRKKYPLRGIRSTIFYETKKRVLYSLSGLHKSGFGTP